MEETSNACKKVNRQCEPQQLGHRSMEEGKESEQDPAEQVHIPAQEMEQALSNPLILKEILKNLDVKNLHKTSLISKLWCGLSREILRSRNCLAVITEHGCPCLRVEQLNEILADSSDVPFVGLSICIQNQHRQAYYKSREEMQIEDFTCNIFSKIDFSHFELKINISRNDRSCKDCINIVQEIFRTQSALITSLKLCTDTCYPQELFSTIFELDKFQLPNCRLIEFVSAEVYPDQKNGGYGHLPLETLQECLTACPNLRRIVGKVGPKHLEKIMKANITLGKFDYVPFADCIEKALTFATTSSNVEELAIATTSTCKYSTFGITEPLEENELKIFHRNFNQQIMVNETLEFLLRRNQTFLTTLDLHHYDLIRLVTPEGIGTPVLRNVKTMKLLYCNGIDSKEKCATLRKINWIEYFPKLTELSLHTNESLAMYHDDPEHEFYIKDNFRIIPPKFTCETLRKIILSGRIISISSQMKMLRDVFPNVKECVWSPAPLFHSDDFFEEEDEPLVPSILQDLGVWEELEGIYISMKAPDWLIAHDSAFLTIFSKDKFNVMSFNTWQEEYSYSETENELPELEELPEIEQNLPEIEQKLPEIGAKLPEVVEKPPNIEERLALTYRRYDKLGGVEVHPKEHCLSNLKYLKTLAIQVTVEDGQKCNKYWGHSRVDCLRQYHHCRIRHTDGLEVKIYRNLCDAGQNCILAMDHLQPFVQLCTGKCPDIPLV